MFLFIICLVLVLENMLSLAVEISFVLPFHTALKIKEVEVTGPVRH